MPVTPPIPDGSPGPLLRGHHPLVFSPSGSGCFRPTSPTSPRAGFPPSELASLPRSIRPLTQKAHHAPWNPGHSVLSSSTCPHWLGSQYTLLFLSASTPPPPGSRPGPSLPASMLKTGTSSCLSCPMSGSPPPAVRVSLPSQGFWVGPRMLGHTTEGRLDPGRPANLPPVK